MSKTKIFVFLALLAAGAGFQSCSSDTEEYENGSSSSRRGGGSSSSNAPKYEFCVYPEIQFCSSGPYESCPEGGSLENSCPFDQSSSSNVGTSSGEGTSSGFVTQSSSSGQTLYDFCVFDSNLSCLNGPVDRCPGSGVLSNTCPYRSSSSEVDLLSSSSNEIIAGEFTDSRDGKEYKTVVIGSQTWMAENLNHKPGSPSGITKCYAEGYGWDTWLRPEDPQVELNCGKYGRLYDWETVMAGNASSDKNPSGVKGICPNGWHIPSRDEWNVLKDYVFGIIWENWEDEDFGWDVGTKLKATSGWKTHSEHGNGVDTHGFKAIGAGFCFSCTSEGLNSAAGSYSSKDEIAYWWTATEYVNQYLPNEPRKQAWRFSVRYDSNALIEKTESKTDLYSVRCVKDN